MVRNGTLPNHRENAVLQLLAQFCGIRPNYVAVMCRIEMQIPQRFLMAGENYRQVKPMGESGLVIYPASSPVVALSKICDHES